MKTSPEPASKPVCWWWVRHAPVPDEYRKNVYGNSDVPADISDTDAFQALAAVVPDTPVCITSPLQRTIQTMRGIADARRAMGGAPLPAATVEYGVIEQNFGAWQGRDRKELYEEIRQNEKANRFWLTPADHAPPGGESFNDLARRTAEAIERISEANPGQHILCASHGGPIRAALGLALGLEGAAMLRFTIENLSLTRCDRFPTPDGHVWRVTMANALPSSHSWTVFGGGKVSAVA